MRYQIRGIVVLKHDGIEAHAAAKNRNSPMALVRAMLGREVPSSRHFMTFRERMDFCIIIIIFGVLVGVYVFTLFTSLPIHC